MQLNFWVVFGFLGQALFFFRFFHQWLASEQVKRSVVPDAFWYFGVARGFKYSLNRRQGLTLYALR